MAEARKDTTVAVCVGNSTAVENTELDRWSPYIASHTVASCQSVAAIGVGDACTVDSASDEAAVPGEATDAVARGVGKDSTGIAEEAAVDLAET